MIMYRQNIMKFEKKLKTLNIKFHGMSAYDEKYIKVKAKEFNGAVNTAFSNDIVPKEDLHHIFIACISIDSVRKMEKRNYPQVYLEECKYRMKRKRCLNL